MYLQQKHFNFTGIEAYGYWTFGTCPQKMRWTYQVCVHALRRLLSHVTITLYHKYVHTALADYGWSRQGESLNVVWDVPRTSKGQNKGYNPYLAAAKVRLVVEVGGAAAERMEDIVGQDANALVVQMFPRQVHPRVAADVKTMTCTRL